MVDFKEGSRYADFDPKVDEVATYGLATLVAGSALAMAAKLGFFKLVWVFILGGEKIHHYRCGCLLAAFFKKFFKRSSNSSDRTTSG